MQATFNEALVSHQRGQLDLAQAGYEAVLKVDPNHFDSLHMLGVLAYQSGLYPQAGHLIAKALAIQPNHPGACSNLGLALSKLRDPEAALAAFDHAISCQPDYATAFLNRGNVLVELKRFEEAIYSYDQAILNKPDLAEAFINRGSALLELDQPVAAVQSYDQAIRINPDRADAFSRRGHALMELDEIAQAADSYRAALRLKADYGLARWGLCFSFIPAILPDIASIESTRSALARSLDELEAWLGSTRLDLAFDAVGSNQFFYLAYEELDNLALLSRCGDISRRIAQYWQNAKNIHPEVASSAGKIRIGIVSDHIREHSVWQAILKGWIEEINRDWFELHIFYLGATHDKATELAQSRADSFTEQLTSVEDWANRITSKQIEVLCYPEIGMESLTYRLAATRLARIQLTTWGHPESSGLPTIDYYLSAELFEPEQAEAHYREQLVKLPNLGSYYSPDQVLPVQPDLKALGIAPDVSILICPGTPFKYSPAYDKVLVEIARQLDLCQFIFFTHKHSWLSKHLAQRLQQVFDAAGLNYTDYVRFIPWQRKDQFYGLLGAATVFLDSLGFSGFNTAIQAIECDLPIVTMAGRYMRGRLASGVLYRIQLEELVAGDESEYIALVSRLCQDREYREAVRSKIRENKSSLFHDQKPIRALEQFLIQKCRPAGRARFRGTTGASC